MATLAPASGDLDGVDDIVHVDHLIDVVDVIDLDDIGIVVLVGKGQAVLGNQVVVHQLIEVSLDQLVGPFDFVEFLCHLGLSMVSWAGA